MKTLTRVIFSIFLLCALGCKSGTHQFANIGYDASAVILEILTATLDGRMPSSQTPHHLYVFVEPQPIDLKRTLSASSIGSSVTLVDREFDANYGNERGPSSISVLITDIIVTGDTASVQVVLSEGDMAMAYIECTLRLGESGPKLLVVDLWGVTQDIQHAEHLLSRSTNEGTPMATIASLL